MSVWSMALIEEVQNAAVVQFHPGFIKSWKLISGLWELVLHYFITVEFN